MILINTKTILPIIKIKLSNELSTPLYLLFSLFSKRIKVIIIRTKS